MVTDYGLYRENNKLKFTSHVSATFPPAIIAKAITYLNDHEYANAKDLLSLHVDNHETIFFHFE